MTIAESDFTEIYCATNEFERRRADEPVDVGGTHSADKAHSVGKAHGVDACGPRRSGTACVDAVDTLDRDIAGQLLAGLGDGLVASAEPAVAFSSLAETCIPVLGVRCVVDLVEDTGVSCRVERPGPTPGPSRAAQVLIHSAAATVPSASPVAAGGSGYHVQVSCFAAVGPIPVAAQDDLLQYVVDTVVEMVRSERTRVALDAAHRLTAQLYDGLATSREIGMAVGILMNAAQLTGAGAFEVLSTVSQNTNRKVRDIASELVRTGTLPQSTSGSSTRGCQRNRWRPI